MDEAWTLVVLSIAMLIGCYLAGSLPLSIPMSEDKLKLVTVLGAGLLVGTALAVIIPEGVHALLSAPTNEHRHDHHLEEKSLVDSSKVGVVQAGAPLGSGGSLPSGALLEAGHDHEHDHGAELHKWIGVALVLGFVFMLLVDQIGGSLHASSSSSSSSSSSTHGRTLSGSENNAGSRLRITATLGLVVHAAADGIALGAAASTSHSDVTMIVFVAIMLHKAPAAFGLSSFLMHEGFDRNRIRKHLAVFALAAPLLAIITYFGLNQRGKEALSDVNATGIAMLFSGGTFLYVATVHILPELAHRSSPTPSALPDTLAPSRDGAHKGFSKLEVVVLVIGCLLPLVLAVGHKH